MNSKTGLFGIDSLLDLTKAAVVAALYIVITMVFAAFSFGPIQLRFSEGLNNLAAFNKRYVLAVTLGCFVSNMMSSLGPIDLVVGTAETLIALVTINLVTRNMKSVPARLAASVLIATFYMFIIAFEIAYVGNTAFWPTFWGAYLTTAIGEFLAMTLGAVVLYFVNLRFDLSK
ncbi:QueT transporter family protein [Lentilactobacillus senioris]|uniref:QueT transporter family protein n=1 Tax=Lentilactobacillus senioris TaxID=931534 RepID=UPI00228133B8|nr:QueT transporter family protein [Lentilactobacillus senioris]MCY9805941.1 QueT transporter family protein [Lentilactobacillus senioris]